MLSQRYGLPPAPTAANVSNSSLAVAEFQVKKCPLKTPCMFFVDVLGCCVAAQGQVWDQDDLDRYQTKCKLPNKVTVDHEAGR